MILAIVFYAIELATPQSEYFLERQGTIVIQDMLETKFDNGIHESLRLESSTGLSVNMRVVRPESASADKLPLVLILGGHRTGRDAVDLVGVPDGMAFAAIDYPYQGEHRLKGIRQIASTMPLIQQALIDTPPALCLALEWLLRQPWVDPDRVELVGVSLGVPFAAAAAAVEPRFSRVWLIHGGGDNVSWLMHAGRDEIENETLRNITARSLLFLMYGNSFDTAARIREIAPRPLIVVAAHDDDFVPAEAQAPYLEVSELDSVELLWTDGLHIDSNRPEVLRQLLDIVLTRVRAES